MISNKVFKNNPIHSLFLGRCIAGQLVVAVSEPIKFRYMRINNDVEMFKMQCYAVYALRYTTNDVY